MAGWRVALNLLKKQPSRAALRLSPIYQLSRRSASGDSSDKGDNPDDIKEGKKVWTRAGPEWVPEKWKDDGMGWGEYPNWKEWSYQHREPRPDEAYFEPQDRRYFGEPVHMNEDALNRWMPDDESNFKYTPYEMMSHLAVALGLIGGVVLWSEYVYDAKARGPFARKPYPYNNLYIERGGDPDVEPSEEELTKRIPTACHGWR